MAANLTAERLRYLLNYNPQTGIFTRRVSVGRHGCWMAGTEMGSPSHGYVAFRVDGICRRAHQFAWLYMTGEWANAEIDHKDCDRTNNRWDNLRLATGGKNHWNRGAQANNSSGFKGIYWHQRPGRRKHWHASIMVEGRKISLGSHSTAEEAHAAYSKAAAQYHGEFARTA